MNKQEKNFLENLELLNGQEIISQYYQTEYTSCVMVKGKDVIQGGKVIDTLTPRKAQRLFNEMFEAEFGSTSKVKKMLDDEFKALKEVLK